MDPLELEFHRNVNVVHHLYPDIPVIFYSSEDAIMVGLLVVEQAKYSNDNKINEVPYD